MDVYQLRPDDRDITSGFVRKPPCIGQIIVQTGRAGVVGGEEPGGAVDIVHLPHISDAGHDVVMRLERIVAEVMPGAQFVVGAGHDLHEPHRTGAGGDQLSVCTIGPAAGFLAHESADPPVGNIEPIGRLPDVRAPWVLGRARRGVIAADGVVVPRTVTGRIGTLATGGQQSQRHKSPSSPEQGKRTMRSGHQRVISVMARPLRPMNTRNPHRPCSGPTFETGTNGHVWALLR